MIAAVRALLARREIGAGRAAPRYLNEFENSASMAFFPLS